MKIVRFYCHDCNFSQTMFDNDIILDIRVICPKCDSKNWIFKDC